MSPTYGIGELEERFGQDGTKGKQLPLAPGTLTCASGTVEGDDLLDGAKPFSELVGCLMYVSVCTRPDIIFAVGTLARHMQAPM